MKLEREATYARKLKIKIHKRHYPMDLPNMRRAMKRRIFIATIFK